MGNWNPYHLIQLLGSLRNQGAAPPTPAAPPAQSPLLGGIVPATHTRDNPEGMFTPEQNLARYQQYAKPGPYTTELSPAEEKQFSKWLDTQTNLENREQYLEPDSVYDMRGFWKGMQTGDPVASQSINPYDKRIHYPDKWKTPRAATFSNESIYALPHAPQWRKGPYGDQYVLPNGYVIFDDALGRWYGMPPPTSNKRSSSK